MTHEFLVWRKNKYHLLNGFRIVYKTNFFLPVASKLNKLTEKFSYPGSNESDLAF